MDNREVSTKIPLSEVPFVMRAMGFYPSEQEVLWYVIYAPTTHILSVNLRIFRCLHLVGCLVSVKKLVEQTLSPVSPVFGILWWSLVAWKLICTQCVSVVGLSVTKSDGCRLENVFHCSVWAMICNFKQYFYAASSQWY